MDDIEVKNTGFTGSDDKTIYAEHEYDLEYQQNLWIALWDDFDRVGRGDQYYINQMKRDFDFFTKPSVGYNFFTSQGAPLDVTALIKDDIYGFKGKRTDKPTGPCRDLTPGKLAVLDVFFKAKFPLYASAFKSTKTLATLVKVFRLHFSKPGDTIVQDIGLETFSGAYVGSVPSLRNRYRQVIEGDFDIYDLHIPVFVLRYVSNLRHLIAHKILLPANDDDFSINSELRDLFQQAKDAFEYKFQKLKPQTYIYSGAGFSIYDVEEELGVKFMCVMRDRTTYSPEIDHVRFGNTGEMVGKSEIAPAQIGSKGEEYVNTEILSAYLNKYRDQEPSPQEKQFRVIDSSNVEYSNILIYRLKQICDDARELV